MDILNFLHTHSIYISLDNLIVGIILLFLLYKIICFIRKLICRKVKIVNLNLSIANIGSVSIEVNKEVTKIAHKTWIEIMTRKVGIGFEEDKDVIVEVYNSWYKLFSIIRGLLKEINPNRSNKDVEKLENILIKALNDGLRPHLTKWQAKFRKWYDNELTKVPNIDLTPQEIQKQYSEYSELINDLKNTNAKMVQFANELKKLI